MNRNQIKMERTHQLATATQKLGEVVESLRVVATLTGAHAEDDRSLVEATDKAHIDSQYLDVAVADLLRLSRAEEL